MPSLQICFACKRKKNTNIVISGLTVNSAIERCQHPKKKKKKAPETGNSLQRNDTEVFCSICSMRCYYMILSGWSFPRVGWSVYKWPLVISQYLSNESAVTGSCCLLKWKSYSMYLRNIPANEDVTSSVQHRPSFCVHHHKMLETWQMISFKTHACRRDVLSGFLFLAFIWVTFITATRLVTGRVLTPSWSSQLAWIYYNWGCL